MKPVTTYDFSNFITVSREEKTFTEVVEDILDYTRQNPDREYRITLGTDSEGYGDVVYASAIVVHRVGQGARAYICKNKVFTNKSLRQKIYTETTLSLQLAFQVVPIFTEKLGDKFVSENLVIHVDVGQNGETKDMIREVVGMVKGNGFRVATKPESYAASTVADRFVMPAKKTAIAQ